eukprot:Filipodium_phascolosomae@DN454_c0_g1_i1.p1
MKQTSFFVIIISFNGMISMSKGLLNIRILKEDCINDGQGGPLSCPTTLPSQGPAIDCGPNGSVDPSDPHSCVCNPGWITDPKNFGWCRTPGVDQGTYVPPSEVPSTPPIVNRAPIQWDQIFGTYSIPVNNK